MHRAKKVGRILDSHFRSVRRKSFFPKIRWRKRQEESSDDRFLQGLASGKVHIIEGEMGSPVRWRLPGMPFTRKIWSAPAVLSGRIAQLFRKSTAARASRPDIRTLLDAASRVIDQISAPEFERIKRSTEYARYQELRKRYYGHQ